MENQMLCYQCGNTDQGKCCNDTAGICGKTAETAKLQDELTGALVGLAKASVHKSIDENTRRLILDALAATASHTDFDNGALTALLQQVQAAKTRYVPKFGDHNTSLKLPEDFDIRLIWQKTPDIRSLKSLLLFGLRGLALIVRDSDVLGCPNKEAASFFHKALIALGANHFKEDYYSLLKEMGGVCLRSLELLTKAKQTAYGDPSATEVERVIKAGPFIIVSGHDFSVLEQVLAATAGSGINVYSHGEMLPAHGYPKFRQYSHFCGHYGTGQQEQAKEFDHIPAAIVFSSDCASLPAASFGDRCFTAGTARIDGVPHIENDFTAVLIRSIELAGAAEDVTFPGINGGDKLLTGFGRKTQRTAAYKLAAALKEGELKHIYVIGGCDGSEEERRYYTELARQAPPRTAFLTWGCCKFRFNDIDLGEIGGVPRILDLGQCGDISQVIATVTAIGDGAKLRVEELPLTLYFTWHGSRSIAAFLALLAADIQNVVLGPTLPPFFTKDVFEALAKEYNISLLDPNQREEPAATEASEEISATEIPKDIEKEEEITDAEEEIEAEDTIDMGENLSVEARSEEAGLPDWAIGDDDDDDDEVIEVEVEAEAETAPKIAPEDIDQTPDFAQEDEEELEAEEPTAEAPAAPRIASDGNGDNSNEAPKITLPKGKGVSGWHDREEEPDFDAERTVVSPIKELTEIVAAPLPVLPAGAGVSGFNEGGGDVDREIASPLENTEPNSLYSFAEAQAEIVIPKGKGVSGWKESDDISPAAKKNQKDKKEEATAKPWLAASLERLHADTDDDTNNENETKTAPAAEPKEEPQKEAAATTEIKTEKPEATLKNEGKPWLAAKLQELHADVEAAAEDAPGKKAAKPAASRDEEAYVSNYRHDESSAAAKPWLNTSLEELHASIDRDSGIKTKRKNTATETNDRTDTAAKAEKWQETKAKSWLEIGSAAPNQAAQSSQAAPTAELAAITPQNDLTDEPSGGEPDAAWTKPPVTPKPWDKDLQTTWEKPAVIPKPWEMQQPTTYHDPAAVAPQGQPPVNAPAELSYEQQLQAYEEQQQAIAAQQAYEQQQQAIAAQQAYEEQQQTIAAQQAYAEQQQAIAAQQAYAEQQQAIAAQQAYAEQQQAIAAQQAYEQQQRALAAQQAYEEQQAASRFNQPPYTSPLVNAERGVSGYGQPRVMTEPRELRDLPPAPPTNIPAGSGISGVSYKEEPPVIPVDYSAVYGVPQTPRVNLPQGAGLSGWNDPNPPQPANVKTFSAGDFFGFRNSDAPAGANRSQSEVIPAGDGDEFITTTGPDGEVILTIRTDKK